MRFASALALILTGLLVSLPAAAQRHFFGRALPEAGASSSLPTLPPGFYVEDAAGGVTFNTPVAVAFAPDGRMFVAEKRGVVWVVVNGVRLSTPFIDLQAEVLDHHDRGLLGITIDGAGRVFLLYTVDRDGSGDYPRFDVFGRLTRYSPLAGDPNRADPASRRVLVGQTMAQGFPSCYFSHTVGTVAIGADGTLLVGAGDGASYNQVDAGGLYPDCFGPGRFPASEDIGAFRSLRLQSLAGKVLRLDPETGRGLPSNPFYNGNPDAAESKVWAYGFRNPYRFTVRDGGSTNPADGEPGLVVAGDVGWGVWEELDTALGGENHAWPCREGPNTHGGYQAANPPTNGCNVMPPHDPPAAYWHHSNASLSRPTGRIGTTIVGGAFFEGVRYPDSYHGLYLYGDYSQGWAGAARLDAAGTLVSDVTFSPDLGFVVDYEYDAATQFLHFVDIAFGRVYRLRHTDDANDPPVAFASADPTQGSAPLLVLFSSAGTFDPDGDPLTYSWAFGDGGTSTAPNPTHTYTTTGQFTAVLTVSDGLATATAQVSVTVGGNPPEVAILAPPEGAAARPGESVLLSAAASDPDESSNTLDVAWTVDQIHNTHTHFNVFSANTPEALFPVPFHGDLGEVVYYRLRVTVTDDDGLTATAERALRVQVAGEADLTPFGAPFAAAPGPNIGRIHDGVFAPRGSTSPAFEFVTGGVGGIAHVGYLFTEAQAFTRVRFQEGRAASGGFEGLRVEVRQGSAWVPVGGMHALPAYTPDDPTGYDLYDLVFPETTGDGLRIAGAPSVGAGTAGVGELRVFARSEGTLPDPWATADVGEPAPGYALFAGGAFEVGGGGEVGGTADDFRFVYRPLVGDGTLTARIASVEGARAWAKGGLMIRAALGASAPNAFLFATAGEGVHTQHRSTPGGPTATTFIPEGGDAPVWLRIRRTGHVFTGYVSHNGTTWLPAGSATIPMGQTVWAGLAVSAADNGTGDLATVRFESVALEAQDLPAPWAATDVGTPPAAGRAAYADGAFTVEGGGDVWNERDNFHYVHQGLIADGTITAHVTSLAGVHPWAKAGLMLRASLAPGAPNVFLIVTKSNGLYLQYRTTAGAFSEALTISTTDGTPVWLRLRRAGAVVSAETSADGQQWTAAGSVTVDLGPVASAGLGVSSADYGDRRDLATAVFRSVSVEGGGAPLPAPWAATDVGAPPAAGAAAYAEGTFTVEGGGDAWNEIDRFHLVHQPLPGDGSITARVASLTDPHPWAKAGVTIRGGLGPEAPHAFLVVTPERGVHLQYRSTAGAPSEGATVTSVAAAPAWLRLQRAGTAVTAFTSTDGATWTEVGTVSVDLGADAVMGLGVSSADYGERQDLAAAAFEGVAVTGGGGLLLAEGHAPVVQAAAFGVEAIYPNPSAGRLTVRLGLDQPGRVRVEVFDLLGRRVFAREALEQAAGVLAVPVDLGDASAGLYVLRVLHLDTGASRSRRLTVAR